MTDIQKLKALAEAVRDLEDSEHHDELAEAKEALWLHMHCHTIIELIAEIERQSAQFKEWQASHHANYCAVADERDQLKAENERLKAENRELKDVKLGLSWAFGELKIDAESLRKDAERYRWLRAQHWNDSYLAVVAHPKESIKLGYDCPSGDRLDAAIDAAVSKEAQP